jgi:hypothetical protein
MDVRLIRDILELFVTAASESFRHHEEQKFRAGGHGCSQERWPGFQVTVDF